LRQLELGIIILITTPVMILQALAKRAEDYNPINVGIIGAGKFGTALVSQIC
jgi:predicted homoserine dehydrogenase-like protein